MRRHEGGRDDWRTPPDLFAALDAEFHFTLDAAASDDNHLTERYLTEAEDGLRTPWWEHSVFCNPPYSDVTPWVMAAIRNSREAFALSVLLLPNNTDNAWFTHALYGADQIRFIRGRVQFIHPPGCGCKACGKGERGSNTGGSLLAIFRPRHLWEQPHYAPAPWRCVHAVKLGVEGAGYRREAGGDTWTFPRRLPARKVKIGERLCT